MAGNEEYGVDEDPHMSDLLPDDPCPSLLRRACDSCRSRKIRCDRDSPCANCVQAKIPCKQVTPKPRPKRTRILVSSQYERKIDLIDLRLDEITHLLQNLHTRERGRVEERPESTNNHLTVQTSTSFSSPSENANHKPSDSPAVGGESSLANHSSFANDYLRQAIHTGNGALQSSNLEMNDFLNTLHQIVDGLKQASVATEMAYPLAKPSIRECELPSIEKTVNLIHNMKMAVGGQKSETLAFIHEFAPFERLSDLCLRIYFSQDYSPSEFIIASAGLMALYQDFADQNPDNAEESLSFAHLARINLETGLNSLPLHLPSTKSMVFALTIGAMYAMEISKPSLCWTLTSKAVEICYTLGLHQNSSCMHSKSDDGRYEQILFWFVYCIDKSLSIRLGRSSSISDWDITTPIPVPDESHSKPLISLLSRWIPTSKCQGKIYDMLYSPDSIAQSDHVRLPRVKDLADEITKIREQTAQLNVQWMEQATKQIGSEFASFTILSDDVTHLSLLTLVYRASPTPVNSSMPFVPECIETARETIQRHQDCMALMGSVHSIYFKGYVHWTLLSAPFISFIVLFCHVIGTQDRIDLERLHGFILSMESAPEISDAAVKMLRLFQVLYTVAVRYVELHSSTSTIQHTQASQDLDAYIAELGLPIPFSSQQQIVTEGVMGQDGGLESGLQSQSTMSGINWQQDGNLMMSSGAMFGLENWVYNNY